MKFALVDGIRAEPQPRLAGTCALCGCTMIAKCGRFVSWHWAHKRRTECDPWLEGETDWHIQWKDRFPRDCQEIVHLDELTGERHIADVKTHNGLVVEVQHSPISEQELRSRENFYGKMIWIVDARKLRGYFSIGMTYGLASTNPISYYIRWVSSSKLFERWSVAKMPVYFDIHDEYSPIPGVKKATKEEAGLLRLMSFNTDECIGILAPVRSDALVHAALNGDPLPLMRCDEAEAHRYSRYWQMVEVPGFANVNET